MILRTMNTGVSIVLAVTVGLAVTWLWTSRGVEPATGRTPELKSVAGKAPAPPATQGTSRPQPAMHSRESSGLPQGAPAAASAAPPPGGAIAAARDDSTYFKMLALMHSRPDTANVARVFSQMHDSFVLTPDDPDWGRRTEQALRDFFRAQPADGGLEITSISCRSEGCEVQALAENSGAPGGPAAEGPVAREPPVALREELPASLPLKQQGVFVLPLGDRSGYVVTYTRVEPQHEAPSP
jgi:hypothetical protein